MLASISVTCENKTEAKKIARVLLKKKLIACVNIFDVESIYWWKGKMVNDQEALMILKTLPRNITRVKQEIISLHSYETPVVTIEKIKTNKEAQKWVREVIK